MARQPRVRRVYDRPSSDDGVRVLVDRLWPRGLSREAARLDEWVKDAAPSSELRRWYGHRVARFPEFARRYRAELEEPAGRRAVEHLLELAGDGPWTLLTATKDLSHAHAEVLADVLERAGWDEPG